MEKPIVSNKKTPVRKRKRSRSRILRNTNENLENILNENFENDLNENEKLENELTENENSENDSNENENSESSSNENENDLNEEENLESNLNESDNSNDINYLVNNVNELRKIEIENVKKIMNKLKVETLIDILKIDFEFTKDYLKNIRKTKKVLINRIFQQLKNEIIFTVKKDVYEKIAKKNRKYFKIQSESVEQLQDLFELSTDLLEIEEKQDDFNDDDLTFVKEFSPKRKRKKKEKMPYEDLLNSIPDEELKKVKLEEWEEEKKKLEEVPKFPSGKRFTDKDHLVKKYENVEYPNGELTLSVATKIITFHPFTIAAKFSPHHYDIKCKKVLTLEHFGQLKEKKNKFHEKGESFSNLINSFNELNEFEGELIRCSYNYGLCFECGNYFFFSKN